MRILKTVTILLLLPQCALAEALTLPADQRPAWLERDGIVMAGSWEPLLFRVRRDGSNHYTPTSDQTHAYRFEQSDEMIRRLKALGVNFVMMHCYKGGGLKAEQDSMGDAVRFAKRCHDAHLRVGVYNYSGAFIWELFFAEMPDAREWVVLRENRHPHTYGRSTYRYYWNRNHPQAQVFYRGLIRFAIEDVGADLLHFDNYHVGPGYETQSIVEFRKYLGKTFSPEQLEQMGIDDVHSVEPPTSEARQTLLYRAWLDYTCRSLAESYQSMARYARSLRKDILLECNPGGVRNRIVPPVDHGQLLQAGEAFWDEGRPSSYRNGQLLSRIGTYKVARRMNNMAFAYTTTPLEMAESMAFNRDCLGCICWFEYGQLVARPGSKDPVSPDLAPYIQFFHRRRDLFRHTRVIADVAVLRSFSSQVLADPAQTQLTSDVEQSLIENRIPFQIIYDHHLTDLSRYRCLLLAGCPALSDLQLKHIGQYLSDGGHVCMIVPTATHDQWLIPRQTDALKHLPQGHLILTEYSQFDINTIQTCCGGSFTLAVEAPQGVCAELMEQPDQRLVHLVNYRSEAVRDVRVRLIVPAKRTVTDITLASPQRPNNTHLTFRQDTDSISFTVPRLDVYEIAVIRMK